MKEFIVEFVNAHGTQRVQVSASDTNEAIKLLKARVGNCIINAVIDVTPIQFKVPQTGKPYLTIHRISLTKKGDNLSEVIASGIATEKHKCICPREVWMNGCKCGGT